jgi:hypothetical protein
MFPHAMGVLSSHHSEPTAEAAAALAPVKTPRSPDVGVRDSASDHAEVLAAASVADPGGKSAAVLDDAAGSMLEAAAERVRGLQSQLAAAKAGLKHRSLSNANNYQPSTWFGSER